MNQIGLNFGFRVAITTLLTLILFRGNAQTEDANTLIQFTGTLYDLSSKAPVKGRITYEKLPHGNNYGIANSDSTGKFDLMILNNSQYSFVIRAQGYMPYREDFSFAESPTEDSLMIQKDFFLSPGGIGHVIRIKNLYFEQSASDIPKSALQELNDIVEMLNENPKMTIQLEGHTDFRGNPKLNYQLSEERVEAIQHYIYNRGIEKKRVKVKALGGTMPLSREDTEEAKKTNRRVEIRVLEI